MGLWLSPFEYVKRIIGGMFMESGFAQYLNIAPCNENTFKPSLIHYNTAMTAYMSSVSFPLQGNAQTDPATPFFKGEVKATGFESLSTGCSNKVDEIVRCSVTYTQTAPTYCDTDEIRRQKKIQQSVKPSVFTGKTQLLIQALYGTVRTDYEINEAEATGSDYIFTFSGHRIGWLYNPHTSGILTTDDFHYYLIDIHNASIKYYELIPSSKGIEWRTHLNANKASMTADNIKRVETYILSTVTVSTTENTINIDLSSVQGLPAAYGWQFNWDGKKADIILHRDNKPADQNWHAYHYHIDFFETSGVITATLTTITSNQVWSGVHGSNVLRPDYFFNIMSVMANPQNNPFIGWVNPATYEAKVYCYYDEDDQLQVFSVKKLSVAAGSINNNPVNYGIKTGFVLEREIKTYNAGNRLQILKNGSMFLESHVNATYSANQRDYYEYTGATTPAALGFDPSFSDHPGEFIEGSGGLTRLQYATAQGWTTPGLGPNGETMELGCTTRANSGFNHWFKNIVVGATGSAQTSLIIPFGSSKAVCAGVKNKMSVSGGAQKLGIIQRNTGGTPGLTQAECHYFDHYLPSGGGARVYTNVRGPFNVSNRQFNQAGSDTVNEYTNSNYSDVNFYEYTFKTEYGRVLFEELGINITSRDKYFDFNYVTDPFGYFHSFGKNGIVTDADNIMVESGFCEKNVNYPYDTAIGWA